MFCSNCGAQIVEGSAFCTQCGAKIGLNQMDQTQEPQQTNNMQQAYQQPNMQMASMNNTSRMPRIISMIGAVLAVIGCFLPFYSISAFGYSEYKTYADGDGMLVIILAIVTLVLCAISRKALYKISLITSGLSLVILIYSWIQVKDAAQGFGNFDIGAYLVALGCVLMVVGGVIGLLCKVPKNVPM